jgi:mannose-6-phosphate isomerase-like protein (cupin superfamily)
MPAFDRAVVSIPGSQRYGQTPFGAPMVIHAAAAETGGTLGGWDTITPPGRGPAGHMHTREVELFLVLESTYHVVCGDDEFDVPTGTVVVLPPHVPHKWWNIGTTTGRMLGIVTPGGCERLFLDIVAEKPADQADIARIEHRLGIANDDTRALGLTQDSTPSMAPFPRAIVSFPTAPPNGMTARGDDVRVRVHSDQTAGRLGAWTATIAPGTGPSWHAHTRETELFSVLSGSFRFWCGTDSWTAGPGSVIVLPPHIPHQWVNIGTEPGELFAMVTPGGFEQMFIDFRALGVVSNADVLAIESGLGVTDSPAPAGAPA